MKKRTELRSLSKPVRVYGQNQRLDRVSRFVEVPNHLEPPGSRIHQSLFIKVGFGRSINNLDNNAYVRYNMALSK